MSRHRYPPGEAELELLRAGYSRPMAAALASVRPDVRDRVRDLVGQVGVKDGAPRVYAVRLLAHKLAGGSRPVPPPGMEAAAVDLVERRADELTQPPRPPH